MFRFTRGSSDGLLMVTLINNGALGGIRTPNRLIRSQVLYPVELRARVVEQDSGGFGRGQHLAAREMRSPAVDQNFGAKDK